MSKTIYCIVIPNKFVENKAEEEKEENLYF